MRPGLPPIPPPPPRRRWLLPAVAAVVALIIGVVGTLLLVPDDADPSTRVVTDDTTDPTAPAPTPSAEAAPPPPPPGGPTTFQGIVLQLPPGWLLEEPAAGTGCVTRTPGACELRVVLTELADGEEPDPESPEGWYLGTDVPACEAGFAKGDLEVRALRPLDDKQAAYREWDVTCGGDPFVPARPRLWWLPKTKLAFLDESDDTGVDRAIDDMVRTADIGAVAAG